VDLYRLEHAEQSAELGLEDLTETSITLVEWPERAEALFPKDTLGISIAEEESGARRVRLDWRAGDWARRLALLPEKFA
jgi:tRNA A37 threonylcarbamoyladenosine biosynthesis protein TsaE